MKSRLIENIRTTVWLAFTMLLPATANGQRQWTLDECTTYALEHNTEIRHLLHEQQRRQINVQSSKDARLPRFSGNVGTYVGTFRHSGDGNRFNTKELVVDMGLMGAVPLYTGNRLSSQIKASKYSLMAATQDVLSAEKNIKVQVTAAYLQLLYNKGEALIAQHRQEVSQMLLKQTNSLFEKGRRPKSDVAEAQAMVSRDEALLAAAEGDVALAKLDLKLLLNLPDTLDFDICEPTDTLTPDNYQLSPINYQLSTPTFHPSIQSANYSIQQAEQGVKTARSGYIPNLSLIGEVGTFWLNLNGEVGHSGIISLMTPWGQTISRNLNFNYGWKWRGKNFLHSFVGLKLTIPIFDAFETRSRIRMAKVNLEDAKVALNDAQQGVQKEIRQAWQGALTAQKRYEAEVKSEESNALAYRYALKRYDTGMSTFYDLSQIRQQWFTASENALRMKYEYLLRKRILDIHTQE